MCISATISKFLIHKSVTAMYSALKLNISQRYVANTASDTGICRTDIHSALTAYSLST